MKIVHPITVAFLGPASILAQGTRGGQTTKTIDLPAKPEGVGEFNARSLAQQSLDDEVLIEKLEGCLAQDPNARFTSFTIRMTDECKNWSMDSETGQKVCDEYTERPHPCGGPHMYLAGNQFTDIDDYYEFDSGGLTLKNLDPSLEEFRFSSWCENFPDEQLPTSLPMLVQDCQSGIFENEAFAVYWWLSDFECSTIASDRKLSSTFGSAKRPRK